MASEKRVRRSWLFVETIKMRRLRGGGWNKKSKILKLAYGGEGPYVSYEEELR